MANYGYYYVVCLRNTGSKRKVLAHGMQRIDLDWCNSRGYDPAEEAMTDFWDSTEIPYSRGWRDYMWDQLERYVYLSDETDYKNRSWMPETDREVLLWVDLHGDEVILDESYIKNRYEIWEWLDANGNTVSSSNQTTSAQSTGSANKVDYKTKIKKLLDYHVSQNQKRSVISWQTKNFNDSIDRVNFYHMEVIDNRKGPSMMREIAVMFFKQSQRWYIKVFVDGVEKIDRNGFKFNNLISELSAYMALPLKNSQEYKDLLESAEIQIEVENYEHLWECVVEEAIVPSHCKFDFSKEDLNLALDDISDDSELGLELGYNEEDRIDVISVAGEPYGSTTWYVDKWADNCYFVRSEYMGQDGGGPEEGIEVEFESIDELWDFLSKREQLDGIPNLRAKKEWVDKSGQKVNLNNAPSASAPANYPSQEKRYKSLLTQIDHDNICTYTVHELTDRILDLTVTTKLKKDISIKIVFKPYVPNYLMEVAGRSVNFDSYAEILDLFEVAQIIKDRSLCEWVDSNGNKVTTSGTKGPSQKTRAKAQTLFGDADDYQEEFKKLYSHIMTVNQKPANTKDERITPICLRVYWINKQGKECRLEVTTTKVQNFKLREQFDYVLSYFDPDEKIISRGLIPSYDELLNVLLKYKVITDKTKCQV
jgi:hypothetical protein